MLVGLWFTVFLRCQFGELVLYLVDLGWQLVCCYEQLFICMAYREESVEDVLGLEASIWLNFLKCYDDWVQLLVFMSFDAVTQFKLQELSIFLIVISRCLPDGLFQLLCPNWLTRLSCWHRSLFQLSHGFHVGSRVGWYPFGCIFLIFLILLLHFFLPFLSMEALDEQWLC